MANFNPREDRAQAAVEQAPAVTVSDVKNHTMHNQIVSLLTGAYLRFSQMSLIVIAKAIAFDLKGHKQNKNRNHFTEASIQSKLQFIALGLEFGTSFSATEIRCIVSWLRKATDTTNNVFATNTYTEQERFAAQMLCMDLREILIPEVVEEETAAVDEEDIF